MICLTIICLYSYANSPSVGLASRNVPVPSELTCAASESGDGEPEAMVVTACALAPGQGSSV